ncbi:glycosyltransferase, partial [bacterium]|nr:glycosyltransferase [bacterium]
RGACGKGGRKLMARVLHIVQSLEAGGAERVVVEYALAHDRSRYEPEICCVVRGGPLEKPLMTAGVPVHILARGRRYNVVAGLRLARLIRRRRYDIVHNHNFTALAVGVPAAVLGGARCIVRTEHNVVFTHHWVRKFVSRIAALREDAQIGVSRAVTRSHRANGRIPARRFVTVWNGINDTRLSTDDDRDVVRAELGLEPGQIMSVTVGSLTTQKDHGNLLAAAQLVLSERPEVRFFIVGGGTLEDEIRGRIHELGLDGRVILLGERLDVPRILAASDVFVLPSAWEGLPITILEVMATSVPCVATDVGGVAEVLADGHNGFVVPARDPRKLADRIVLLAGDASLRQRMARAARDVYEAGFTAEAMVRQTESLYDLARAGSAARATSDRIKVLFVIRQLGYGGAERQLVELAARLPRDRFEAVVCTLSSEGALADEIRRAGVRVVVLETRTGILSGSSLGLFRLIMRERPTILHSYLFPANWRTAIVGRVARVPLVITSVRNVDVHALRHLRLAERVTGWLSDRVLANAEAVRDYIVKHHRTAPRKVRVICNGVSIRRIAGERNGVGGTRAQAPGTEAASGHDARDGAPATVVMIASLTPKKDHGTFLKAARLIADERPDTRFLIVGDGPLAGHLMERARALGLEGNVEFLGETSDIGGLLSCVDISVLTSLKEGCSNVILESMAAGKPVVATSVGGNPELVVEGDTGYLVPPRDAAGVARRVLELLADDGVRTAMGARGRERVFDGFTAVRMVEQTARFYEEELAVRLPGLVAWAQAISDRQAHHSEPRVVSAVAVAGSGSHRETGATHERG